MCEYEYAYLIFTWVRALYDDYECKYEYQSMIFYKLHSCIFSVTEKGYFDSYKPGTIAPTTQCIWILFVSTFVLSILYM